MNILITGSSGFVGTNLLVYLRDHELSILTVDRRKQSYPENNISSIEYDAFWENNIEVNNYVHLAGKAHDLKNTSEESEYFAVNFELTKKLFNRFLKDNKARTFIFISSVKAVSDKVLNELKESDLPNPVTAYGLSKLKAETYILDNLPVEKTVVILRPCMIHGPENKGNLNLLFKIARKGMPWPLGNYNNKRSFLSIDNFCYVIEEILNENIPQGIYNLADDESLSTNQIIEMISEELGRRPKILNIPKPVIQFVAKLGNKLPLPLNEERLQKLTENYLVSNKKLASEIGKPLPVSAREGMRKTIEYLIEENG